jgi:hypothetical protein
MSAVRKISGCIGLLSEFDIEYPARLNAENSGEHRRFRQKSAKVSKPLGKIIPIRTNQILIIAI